MLKSAKMKFEKRVSEIRSQLEAYQSDLEQKIEGELIKSQEAIINYYEPVAKANPPDAAHGLFDSDVRAWLKNELDKTFPTAKSIVSKLALEVDYKDVTYETLQSSSFLEALRNAFPSHNWEKAHNEYSAAGEAAK